MFQKTAKFTVAGLWEMDGRAIEAATKEDLEMYTKVESQEDLGWLAAIGLMQCRA